MGRDPGFRTPVLYILHVPRDLLDPMGVHPLEVGEDEAISDPVGLLRLRASNYENLECELPQRRIVDDNQL